MINWSCDKKVLWRMVCIVELLRARMGRQYVPKELQYWSMCAENVKDGKVIEWSEYDHIVNKDPIITPTQWRGVDISEEKHLENSKLANVKWINSDFRRAMIEAEFNGEYRPAFVNLDTQWQVKKAMCYMADLMPLISRQPQEVILVTNLMVDHKLWMKNSTTANQVAKMLEQEPSYRMSQDMAKWEFPTWPNDGRNQWGHYVYDGADSNKGDSLTTMATFIAVKLAR